MQLSDEILDALKPLFELYGEQEVLDIIHNYYHNRHRG